MREVPAAVCAVFLAWHLSPVFHILNPSTPMNVNSSATCDLIGEDLAINSEDLAMWTDGRVLVSVGDLGSLLFWGDYSSSNGDPRGIVEPGSIAVLDVNTKQLRKLKLTGLPEDLVFQPHGIHFSNSTGRIYCVSHGFARGGSRIIILKLEEKGPGGEPHVVYERSITSPHFFNAGLNDVIEGSANGKEIYVTQYLQFPLPINGKHYPSTWGERLDMLKQELFYLDIPGIHTFERKCKIFHCVWKDDQNDEDRPDCTVVAEGSPHFNGITISTDRSTIFANDLFKKRLLIFSRDDNTGALVSVFWLLRECESQLCGKLRLRLGPIDHPLRCLMNAWISRAAKD
jgi:hypothetical protein